MHYVLHYLTSCERDDDGKVTPQDTVDTKRPARDSTSLGALRESLLPWPSMPLSPAPHVYNLPVSEMRAYTSSDHE